MTDICVPKVFEKIHGSGETGRKTGGIVVVIGRHPKKKYVVSEDVEISGHRIGVSGIFSGMSAGNVFEKRTCRFQTQSVQR